MLLKIDMTFFYSHVKKKKEISDGSWSGNEYIFARNNLCVENNRNLQAPK